MYRKAKNSWSFIYIEYTMQIGQDFLYNQYI